MEQKTVKSRRRKYEAEFKKEVIKMIESGRSVPELAQSLGIGNNPGLLLGEAGKEKRRYPSR